VGLHLLGGLILLRALENERSPQTTDDPAFLLLDLPASAAVRRPAPRPVAVRPAAVQPAAQAVPTPLQLPLRQPAATLEAPNPAQPTANWNLEASRAASDVLAANALEQRRDRAMGSIPVSPYHHAAPPPSFPWSRQPLGKHFDADLHSGMVTLRGKRCMIGLFIILPVFGCDAGHLDPEPGRGDLFDPKYKPQPLEVARSLSEQLADPR
jgi:hypothetical protein